MAKPSNKGGRGGPRPAAGEAFADADVHAFRAAVRGVTPLAQVPVPAGLAPARKRRRRKPAAAVESLEADLPLIDAGAAGAADAVAGADVLSFQRAGVQLQVLRRLRRGLIPIDDELDLHGQHQNAARELLARFIPQSRAAGCRCVRIIHGKGYRSGARGPVLKIAVNHWLRRHLDVMAFVSARAIDGGTGALYVLLRA